MKKLFSLVLIAAGGTIFGCAESVEKAQRDVRTAHQDAVQDVRKEQQDLEDVKRDAAERIARQERRVEDTARSEQENIIQEKRELQDAKDAEARRLNNDTVTPRTNDRTNTTPNGGARVDVNINR
jgi:phosphoenolpyruvate-protein kinase (PTS system EI component)